MRQNAGDYLAGEGARRGDGRRLHVDPTITPMMDGDSVVAFIGAPHLEQSSATPSLVDDERLLARRRGRSTRTRSIGPAAPATRSATSPRTETSTPACSFPCRAETCGSSGSRRSGPALRSWRRCDRSACGISPDLFELRPRLDAARACPGLAYMEGNMRGPSSADCEKSLLRAGALPSPARAAGGASQ